MLKKILFFSALGVGAIALISGTLMSTGSPGKKTGSPLDGGTCVSCHTGSAVEVKMKWISSDIPETGYKPKGVYNLLVSAEDATAVKVGFELTAENSKAKVGTFRITESTRTKLVNGGAAVTNTDKGNLPDKGLIMWTVEWTAPEVASGDITFYGAFNAANGNRNTSGDQIFTSTYTVKQDETLTSLPNTESLSNVVYPNPAYGFVIVQSANPLEVVSVYNLQGQMVKSEKVSSKTAQINLSELESGNYLIKAVSSKGEFIKKVQLKN